MSNISDETNITAWMDMTSAPPDNTTTQSAAVAWSQEDLMGIGHFVAVGPLYDATTYISIGLGIPSNVLSFLTSSRMRPVSSSIIFISVLALVDLLYILWDTLFWILIPKLEVKVNDEACRLYFYLGTVLVQFSVWLMVAITGERFIAVWLPLKVSTICTMKRALGFTLACLALLMLINIPLTFVPYSYETKSGQWFCGYHPDYQKFIKSWTFVDNSVYGLIPLPILAFCNVMIILGLRKSAKRKQRLTNQTDNPKDPNKGITVMLLTASVVAFILLFPNMVFFIFVRSSDWNYQATAEDYATYVFTGAFVYFLSIMNHVFNFWLYVVSGRRFRQVFIDLICCHKKGAKYAKPGTTMSKVSASKSTEPEKSEIKPQLSSSMENMPNQ